MAEPDVNGIRKQQQPKLKVAWKIENCMLQYEKSFQLQPGSLPLDPTDGGYAPRPSLCSPDLYGPSQYLGLCQN